jgi:hypothetical protein
MKVKYAIYQGKVGLYAKEYFDKIDPELFIDRGVLGWNRIKEEDLPIVVNSVGGRCSFYPVEGNFKEIIEVEEDQEPLTREQCFPKNSPEFEFGWISPEGDTYNTGFEGHYRAAIMICAELGYKSYLEESQLEEKGWIKITKDSLFSHRGSDMRRIYSTGLKMTKKQADTLVDLGFSSNDDFKALLDFNEDRW